MYAITTRSALGVLTCILMVCNVIEQRVRADTESPRVVLTPAARGLVVGPGMNAAGRDLRGCEFVTQNLTGAVFDGCNLYGVRIHGCILKRASFRGAIFTGADVEVGPEDGADFTDATINGLWRSSTEGFHFDGPRLSPRQLMSTWSYKNKDLRQCSVFGSHDSGDPISFDLRGADLRQARIGGDLSKCDFTNARIRGAFFGNDSITFEQLASTFDYKRRSLRVRLYTGGQTATVLSGKWDFSRIHLKGSDLSYPPPDADFTDARIEGCTIRGCTTQMGLTRPQLYSTASYRQGNISGLRLMRSDLSGCDLSGMNLTDCMFSHCKFASANFEDAVITGAWIVTDKSVAKSDRLTIEQIKSTWNYKHGHMEGIILPEEIAKALKKEQERNP